MGFKLNKLCEKAKVQGIEKQVLSKLCDHASEKNNYSCWPSTKVLAREIGRSIRSIQRSIKSLKEKKYIYIRKTRWNDGVYLSNIYTINIEKLNRDNGIFEVDRKSSIIKFPK